MIRLSSALAALALLALAPVVSAQSNDDVRRVVLKNGSIYVGTVVDETSDPVVVVTRDGITRQFARDQIDVIAPLIKGRFFRTDPVRSRLFAAPTARTLGDNKVRGDLTPYPSVTYGITDRVDILATGVFTFGTDAVLTPLIGLKGQLYASESVQVAAGTSALFFFGDGDSDGFVAVPYGVVSLGDETGAVSFGAGGLVGGGFGVLDEVDIADGVVVGVGAEKQINNGIKLFVETLTAFTSEESGLLAFPGVRFFGDKLALDVIGVVATDFENGVYGFAPAWGRLSYTF